MTEQCNICNKPVNGPVLNYFYANESETTGYYIHYDDDYCYKNYNDPYCFLICKSCNDKYFGIDINKIIKEQGYINNNKFNIIIPKYIPKEQYERYFKELLNGRKEKYSQSKKL